MVTCTYLIGFSAITIFAFNLLGDGLRDAWDQRLREKRIE